MHAIISNLVYIKAIKNGVKCWITMASVKHLLELSYAKDAWHFYLFHSISIWLKLHELIETS